MKASEIMTRDVVTIGRNTSIEEVARLLTDHKISGVPVVEDGRIVGMVTEKDLLYKDVEPRFPAVVEILGGMIFLNGVRKYQEELRKLVATKAEDVMTKHVIVADVDMPVEEVAQRMVEKDINRIPVVEAGKLVGIISRADIIRYIANTL